MLPFLKYEGLSNDFILVEEKDAVRESLSQVVMRALCHRHRGVGADGILIYSMDGGKVRMWVINADGTPAEMCGNGLRCVVLALHHHGGLDGTEVEVVTDAGSHSCRVISEGVVEAVMLPPSLDPQDLPSVFSEPLIDTPVDFDGESIHLTGVSMGNPHVVSFDVLGERRTHLGPRIEEDERFPERVNVGFASPSLGGFELHVWERGCGWTQACGTGACAAAVAAVETGRAERNQALEILLPGGALQITVGEAGAPVLMRGPARRVFQGELDIESFRA